jgi:SHS2 domain-containing protein
VSRPYRFLSHTADLRIEVRGRDHAALFAACVEALFSLVTDRRRVRRKETRTAQAEGDTPEERLFLLLREALALFAVHGFLVRGAHVTMKGKRVAMTAVGERADPYRHAIHREIKAVTAHALDVRRTPEGILARFVVDV